MRFEVNCAKSHHCIISDDLIVWRMMHFLLILMDDFPGWTAITFCCNHSNIVGDELLLNFGAKFQRLYYYMRNFCNLIGLEQWHFSLIWNTYVWKLHSLLLREWYKQIIAWFVHDITKLPWQPSVCLSAMIATKFYKFYEWRCLGIKRCFGKPKHKKENIKKGSNRHFDETFRKSLTEPNLSSKSLRKLLGFRQYARESIP